MSKPKGVTTTRKAAISKSTFRQAPPAKTRYYSVAYDGKHFAGTRQEVLTLCRSLQRHNINYEMTIVTSPGVYMATVNSLPDLSQPVIKRPTIPRHLCQCEHAQCAHEYLGVKASVIWRAHFVGPICEDCARTHMSTHAYIKPRSEAN